MEILDHEPQTIENVKGLFGRGAYNDTVPFDHLINGLNTITIGREIKTRDGFIKGVIIPNARRSWEYKRTGEASRMLVLDSSGRLYDTTLSLVTPILTIGAMTDFSAISQYNRAYITPHNGVSGLPGDVVYVYNGSTCRAACGVAPSSGFTVAISATPGNVESGIHILAVCFETDSGFITAPGQFRNITVDGTTKIDITAIPLGPTGTSARRIVATRAIQANVYTGDLQGYELFFVPNGRIADNTSTSLTVNFYDADLQTSADYTFDQLSSIPAVVNICNYGTKLVYISTDTDKSLAYVSKNGEPESVNANAGFLLADPSETEGLKSGVEYRDSLYLTKGSQLYSTRDNNYDPSTWTVATVDKGIGASVFSLSSIQDKKGANQDFFVLGDESGLYLFNGTIVRPELSYKILNWWQRINKAYFNTVQIIIDTKKFLIYVLAPLDSATSPSSVMVGDYTEGMDYKNIRWHIWEFNASAFAPRSMTVSINNTTKLTYLRLAGYAGNIYDQTVGELNDDNFAIQSFMQVGLQYIESSWVHHCAGIGLRVRGSGNLSLDLYDEDNNQLGSTLVTVTLAATPGREYFRHANVNNEKISVRIGTNAASKWFNLKQIILYLRPVWATRPS